MPQVLKRTLYQLKFWTDSSVQTFPTVHRVTACATVHRSEVDGVRRACFTTWDSACGNESFERMSIREADTNHVAIGESPSMIKRMGESDLTREWVGSCGEGDSKTI